MAKTIAFKTTLDNTNTIQSLESMETNLESLKEQIRNTTDPAEFKRLGSEIKASESEVKNLNKSFEGLDSEAQAGKIGQLAGGIGAMATAAALVVGENENFEAFFQTFATGMAITQAVKGAIEAWTAAQEVLNIVMTANPIGLIIVGVAALIAGIVLLVVYFDQIIDYMTNLNDVILILLGPIGLLILAYKLIYAEELEAESQKEANIKKEKARSEQRIRDIKRERKENAKAHKERQSAFDLQIETLEAEGKASFAVTMAKLQDILDEKTAILEASQAMFQEKLTYYQNIAKLQGQSDEEFKKSMLAQGVDFDALTEQFNKGLQNQKDAAQRAQNAITKANREHNEERRAENKKTSDDKIAQEEKDLAHIIAIQEKIDALSIEQIENEQERNDAKAQAKFEKMVKNLDDSNAKELELIKLYEQQLFDTLDANQLKVDEANEAKKLKEQADRDAEIEAEKEKNEAIFQSKIDGYNKSIDLGKQGLSSATNLANSIFTMTDNMGKQDDASKLKRAKRQFEIQKGFSIAEAGLNTATAIVKAIAQFGPPPSPLGIAGIATAGIIGAAQIGAIASAKFSGGSVGSVSAPSSSVPSANTGSAPVPSTNTLFSVPGAGTEQLGEGAGSTQSAPIQAFVVESDITNTQNELSNLQQMSEIG